MKQILFLFSFIFIFFANTSSATNKLIVRETKELSFTENKGQVHDQNYKSRADVLYSGSDGQLTFHLKNNGISYQQFRIDSWKKEIDPKTKEEREAPDQTSIYRIDVSWLNCNLNAIKLVEQASADFSNYYSESCPNGALNVKSYGQVTYKQLYNGIDLKWYQKGGHLKYDYIVKVGANYKQIQLVLDGAESININNKGELILKTPLGTIVEQAPLVIQNGKHLKSKWVIKNNIISFDIENINPKQDFIIDPIIRNWGTYYGGTSNTIAYGITTDSRGNVYATGSTQSPGNIATVGAHQITYGGNTDAFFVKYNNVGMRKWSTYYGGTGSDTGYSCPVDSNGYIYLAGSTGSSSGIATSGSYQTLPGGGFLAKFDSLGVRQWATYYIAGFNSCAIDSSNNIYAAGTVSSSAANLSSPGSHQSVFGGGSSKAFLVKFDASGARQWATYYGGTGDETGDFCAVEKNGNVYMSGVTTTSTSTSIATPGAHQSVYRGFEDGFLVKFNSSGVRQWGTYYGGNSCDGSCSSGNSCAVDLKGNVYLTGSTQSIGPLNSISSPGSHQPAIASSVGKTDGYIAKFNNVGVRQWATYYGSGGIDTDAKSCVTDANGNVYLSGRIDGAGIGNSIATSGSYQSVFGGGTAEAYLVKFDSLGVRKWGTYYGGTGYDIGYCAIDKSNNTSVFLLGATTSSNGISIATPGSDQPNIIGSISVFLVKFSDCPPPASPVNITSTINQNICANNSATLSTSGSGIISWFSAVSGGTVLASGSSFITPTLSAGTYTYYVQDSTCSASVNRTPIVVTVNNSAPTLTVTGTNSLCLGSSANLNASGAATYFWSTGGLTASINVSPTASMTYSVDGTNGCGTTTQTVSIIVDNTCADVWPGDANSDGATDNLDVLELGLHYAQTGVSRAVISNSWQSYFANNWAGTITNGKNLSHSDCNGDGTINDDDTLAIYNNYGLTHTFKPAQTNTVNPQLSIVPDQSMVTKGNWGTASVYLGDVTSPITNINGIAFTIDFDNTLIEPTNIYIEYQNSFIDAGQNLYFRKLDFGNGKIFTASTHTISNNVSGNGKIATLHYQILSSLTTDQVLNIGLSQANQSDASGTINPLTSGTGTLMAIGASVGVKEISMNENVQISPNPTKDILNITLTTLSQNTKIEIYNTVGALVITESLNNKTSSINIADLSNGLYFLKVLEGNKVVAVKKVVKEKVFIL